MSEKKMIKNIIFDLGGVLLNIDYLLTSNAFKRLGWSNFDAFYSQKNQKEIFNKFETGKLQSKDFIDYLQKQVPKASSKDLIDAWNAMLLDLPQNRIQLVKELAKTHKVFLLSNTNALHYEAFTKQLQSAYPKFDLSQMFDKAYFSHLIGMRKPNAEVFSYLLEEQRLVASETLFIDDSIQHIIGASQLGIATHHLQPQQNIIELIVDRVL